MIFIDIESGGRPKGWLAKKADSALEVLVLAGPGGEERRIDYGDPYQHRLFLVGTLGELSRLDGAGFGISLAPDVVKKRRPGDCPPGDGRDRPGYRLRFGDGISAVVEARWLP